MRTAGDGVRAIRASPVLVMLAVAIFLAGGASEAYDRYADKYLLVDLGTPAWPGWSGLTWMAVLACTSALLGIVVPWWFQRRHRHLDEPDQRRWIVWLIGAQVAGLVTMALTGSFVIAAVATLVIDRVRSLCGGLLAAWIVPLTPRRHRATVLSTFEQTDSISQVTIGPGLGVIGQVAGIPAALAASAVLLAPSALAVRLAGRRVHSDDAATWSRGAISPRLADVDHPGDAELVVAHAELVAPHLLLERHGHRAAGGELGPVAAQLVAVVAAEADAIVFPGLVLHPGRRVGGHQGEAAGGLEHAVHDLVGLRPVRRMPISPKVLTARSPPKTPW